MSSLNMLLLLCCVWFIYDMDYGEALGGRQKRTIPEVNLKITERREKTKIVKIGRPLQGLCSTPAGQSNNTVLLRIYFVEQSTADSLEGEYSLNLSDGKFANAKPSRKTTAVKYARDGTVNAIAFKVCVSTNIKIHCIAQDSNGKTIGLKSRDFEVNYEPMRPIIVIKPHLDGTVLLNVETTVHCIAYVGTNGRLEIRMVRPYSYYNRFDKWIIYYDSPRVETNAFIHLLRYWKGFNYYGPYIQARVKTEVEERLECTCFAINAFRSRRKRERFPKQIEISVWPKMYVLDNGNVVYATCTNPTYDFLPELPTALFYKDSQGTIIYSKENENKHKEHKVLNASYTGMSRRVVLRDIGIGLQILISEIGNRTTFTFGCVLNGYQICRYFTRNLTKLGSMEGFSIIANAMAKWEKTHKNEKGIKISALSFGQFALIAVGLGFIFGLAVLFMTRIVRGKNS